MISLDNSGIPRDDQLPDLAPATLRLLSDRIADAADCTSTPRKARVLSSRVVGDALWEGGSATGIYQRRPWVRRTTLIAAAAAAALAVTSVVLPSPPAEAWSATPALADADAWATLATECQDMMGTSAPAVLVEQRGTSSFTVLDDSSLCLNATDLAGLEGAGPLKAGGRDVVPVDAPEAGTVQVVHATSLGGVGIAPAGTELPDGVMTAGYMGITGRAGAGVEDIVIHVADLGDITASLENGWFAAWWPSLIEPTSLTVTTGADSHDVDL